VLVDRAVLMGLKTGPIMVGLSRSSPPPGTEVLDAETGAQSAPCGLAVTNGLVAGSSPAGPTAFRRFQVSGTA